MNELRAANITIEALEHIRYQLKDIDHEDLTRAELNILRIANKAIDERNILILGKA